MDHFDIDFGDETDLQPKRLRVRIGGKPHVVKEAFGDEAAKYKNACMAAARMDDGKIVGMTGLADAEYFLVALCTYEVLPSGEERNNPVALPIVRRWPNRVTRRLYDWIKEYSALEEKETEESLAKEIAKLQERLAKLRQSGPFPGAPASAGADGSGSPTS